MYLFIHIHRNVFSRVFFYACPVWLVYPDAQDITWKTVHWKDLQLSLGISSWLMIRNGTNYLQDGAPQL